MAHEIESMAYVDATPWHGLGNQLTPQQPIDIWQREAGMDWQINESEVMYSVSGGNGLHLKSNPDSKVLFRSDNFNPLASGDIRSYESDSLDKEYFLFIISSQGLMASSHCSRQKSKMMLSPNQPNTSQAVMAYQKAYRCFPRNKKAPKIRGLIEFLGGAGVRKLYIQSAPSQHE